MFWVRLVYLYPIVMNKTENRWICAKTIMIYTYLCWLPTKAVSPKLPHGWAWSNRAWTAVYAAWKSASACNCLPVPRAICQQLYRSRSRPPQLGHDLCAFGFGDRQHRLGSPDPRITHLQRPPACAVSLLSPPQYFTHSQSGGGCAEGVKINLHCSIILSNWCFSIQTFQIILMQLTIKLTQLYSEYVQNFVVIMLKQAPLDNI